MTSVEKKPMTYSLRVFVAVGLLLGGVVGLAQYRPDLLGLDGLNVFEVCEAHAAIARRRADLERRDEVCLERIQVKQRVIAALFAGEFDLFQAAAWFLDLNAHPADLPD